MSRMEVHTGVARPTGLTLEQWLENNLDLVLPEYIEQIVSNPYEVLYSGLVCGYAAFVEIDGEIYELDNKELEEHGYSYSTKNPDGSFNYNIMFYNGGCGFTEAVEAAIKKGGGE